MVVKKRKVKFMRGYEDIKVAIGMATCNTDAKMLEQAIDSILNQSHSNFKFYIVNDSGANIEQLQNIKDERVIIIAHESRLGLAKSMNEIIELMEEKYFFRMDSDDIAVPDRLLKQILFMEENDEIDIASMCGMKFGVETGPLFPLWNDPDHIKSLLFFTNTFIHSSIVIRTNFLKRTGIRYDDMFMASQDYEMWSRCSSITKMFAIPQIGILYRIHNNQISNDKRSLQQKFLHEVMERNLQELGLKKAYVDYLDMLVGKKQITDFETYTNFILELFQRNELTEKYEKNSFKEVVCFYYFRSVYISHLLQKSLLEKKSRNIVLRYTNIKNFVRLIVRKKLLEKQKIPVINSYLQ